MKAQIEELETLRKKVFIEWKKIKKNLNPEVNRPIRERQMEKCLSESFEDLHGKLELLIAFKTDWNEKPKQLEPEPYKPPALPTDGFGFVDCEVID